MKFGKVGQVVLVSAIALVLASAFTACGTLTVGFLFVPTNKQTPGQIEVYEVNSEAGTLRTIPTSPFPSGGRDPIAEAVSPAPINGIDSLYAANQDDNNIVQFTIGTDGKLYPQSTINTPGTYPLALAINSAGTYEYVLDTLGPVAGCSLANPCPGIIAGYAVTTAATASGTAGSYEPGTLGQVCVSGTCTLGTPVTNSNNLPYVNLLESPGNKSTVLTPTAINITANGNFLYVTAYLENASTTTATYAGFIFGFSISSTGALTAVNGGVPVSTGGQLVALTSDTASQSLYVVDETNNQVESYSIGSDGTLTAQGSTPTGNQPSALTLVNDKYLYVTNSLDSTINAYAASAGTLTKIGTYATDTNPIAVVGDPRNLGFLYTVNFLNGTLSGYKINQTDGSLINTDHSPYLSSAQPTTITGIPHGGSTH
jgi:6-phosphogluconolactonase (cycloisomerase 2 family)